ncbi:MAG: hypothetical protein WCN95_05835 [bacterium]
MKTLLIESEKGRECVLQNPWPGHELQLYRNGSAAETLKGDRVNFKTGPGESIAFAMAAKQSH